MKDTKKLTTVNIDKMFDLHLKQLKVVKAEISKEQLEVFKKHFYNAVAQMLVLLQEVHESLTTDKINHLFNDMMVQVEIFFQKEGYAKMG